jgi:uncharacterized protein YjbJ (UPF0337 family)
MDWSRVERDWEHFKDRIRRKWGRLTDKDLEAIGGSRDRLIGKIQQRYGFAEDHIRKEVDDWSRWQTFEIAPQRTPLRVTQS